MCEVSRIRILTLVIAILSIQGVAYAQLSVENEFFLIELVGHEGYPRYEAELRITDKKSAVEEKLVIEARIKTTQDLFFVQPNKVLLTGTLPRGGTIMALVQVDSVRLLDVLWMYEHAFSPTREFLIYQTHVPRMGPPAFRQSILLLYDFRKMPEENRTGSVTSLTQENAGIPVFPETNWKLGSYYVAEEAQHVFLSDFLWSPQGDRVVFLDFWTRNKQNYFTVIDLTEGLENLQLFLRAINLAEITTDEVPEAKMPYKLAVRELEWTSPEAHLVRVVPYGQRWLKESFLLEVRSVE